MKTALKPFTTLVSLPTGAGLDETASAIPLVDSQGNSLECNYISIQSVSGDINTGAFGMFFSSLSGTPAGVVSDINGTGNSTFGVIGNTDAVGGGVPVEVFLGDTNRVSEVQIGLANSVNVGKFALTYGVRVPINPLRAKDRPTGE